MKPQTVWWIAAALVITSSAGLYGMSQFTVSRAQTPDPAPTPKPKVNVVGALGRIEPRGEMIEINGPAGERIGELLVEEGQVVSQGTELIRLESYAERLAERNYALSQLVDAQDRLAAQTQYSQAKISEARTRIRQADTPLMQGMEAQRAQIRQLQAELANAQLNLNRFADLQREGAVSQQELDARTLTVEQKQEALNNAEATLRQLDSTRDTTLSNAQAQVQSAQANQALSRSQIEIRSLTQNVQLAEARLDRTIIRAPRNGQILKILRYPGQALNNDQGILQFGDTQQMMVVAEVYETDVSRIQRGQMATIAGNTFSQKLRGKVDVVGLQIRKKDVLNTDPAADIDSRVVEVKIKLDPESSRQVAGLTNMQVKVEIAL